MSIYNLTNVPRASQKTLQIRGEVDGEMVRVVCVQERTPYGAACEHSSDMCSTYVGAHMFEPQNHALLRKMFADSLASAIRMARDVGYRQAMAELRELIGAKP